MKKNLKLAVASPKIKLCDPLYNAVLCADAAKEADVGGADIIVFPELALTGATCGDLYFQEILLDGAERALMAFVDSTAELEIMSFIGLPLRAETGILNAVACVSCGEIIGITVSGGVTRHFIPLPEKCDTVSVFDTKIRVGRDLIYTDADTGANVFVKVGEDDAFSNDNANVIINPIAMPEYVGLAKKRRAHAEEVSSALGLTYVIAGAGEGESGTDGIYASPRLVYQNGMKIAESDLFDASLLYADIDLKTKKSKAPVCADSESVTRSPFIPDDRDERESAAALALELQARSLALRMERAYAKSAVIGVSGGLDSTLAVLVAAKAMDIMGRDRSGVIAITMPCFGTTARTKNNALALADELGCNVRTIDIKAAVNQHFADIGHDEKNYNVVYENAQARERTQILMDIANAEGGMVIGTGDLSELALGFATYNGDHMSMYCVNGSVPKTFMRTIIEYSAKLAKEQGNDRLSHVLLDVISTPVSPELLPAEGEDNGQHTESIVGPYELHDFFLYYTVKYGYSPSKVLALAHSVFTEYNPDDVRSYLDIFVRRFFTQQFKRSCLPDGPRVTEISLSPRGAWQMPSDVSAALWRNDLDGKR